MSPRTVERVDDWNAVPFAGGYGGLRDLASQEFSGVVTAGPTRLFMIRGTVVGTLDGSIDDFEESDGSAREAPHPALPLLAVMQERSDEVRAKYYTEDTPLSDVDGTLSDGGFTGYVELSENVLSGDYYQVYHQGRSMSVAYVGAAERLKTDDDAFEHADDEVGIFEVRPVDIDPIDIPEPPADAGESAEGGPTGSEPATDGSSITAGEKGDTVADDASDPEPENEDTPSMSAESGASEPTTVEDPIEQAESPVDSTEASADPTTVPDESIDPVDDSDVPHDGTDDPAERSIDASTGSSSTPPDASSSTASGTEAADSTSTTEQAGSDSGKASVSDRASPSREESRSHRHSTGEGKEGSDRQTGRSNGSTGNPQSSRDAVESDNPTSSDTVSTERPLSEGTGASSDSGAPGAISGSQDGGRRSNSPSSPGTAADLEVRSIPSLDPSRTEVASKTARSGKSKGGGRGTVKQPRSEQSQQHQQSTDRSRDQSSTQQSSDGSTGQSTQRSSQQSDPRRSDGSTANPPNQGQRAQQSTERTTSSGEQALENELESRTAELEELRDELESVENERDGLETARADLEAERDRLQSELEESRAEVDRLTERLEDFVADGAEAAETQLTASEAVDDTNLFVRYRSKGEATLETAHAGDADQGDVGDNLRLEHHTQFEADDAVVGNEPFDDFLTDTVQYRFVDWLVGSLLYEIRDTGHAGGMADLYDALPRIDRAELNGQVSVTYTENGEEHRSQERFDVVVRDRMGNPLVVANINDSRDPATDAMMTDLVKRAERVGESSDALAGAFLVTESFFEPEALETAEGATSSGLFSRDKRESFVNLSRKGGYHLCLVEARNREFHLAVPEL